MSQQLSMPLAAQVAETEHKYLQDALALATSDPSQMLSLDTETSSKNPRKARVCGFSFSDGRQTFYIPIAHNQGNVDQHVWKPILDAVLQHPLVGHNTMYDKRVLANEGYDVNFKEDTLIIAYAVGEYDFLGLKYLVDRVLRHRMTELSELFPPKKPINVPSLPPQVVRPYAEDDALQTYKLYNVLAPQLTANTRKIYRLEQQLTPVTANMEEYGVPVNREFMISEGNRLLAAAQKVRKAFYLTIAEHFGISEIQAMRKYPDNKTEAMKRLFYGSPPEGLGLKPLKQTKAGADSTDESALKSYRSDYPLVNALLSIRELETRGKRYYLKIADMVEDDGCVHADINQFGATSGRYGSSNPNVQNWSAPGHWEVYYPGHEILVVDESFRSSLQVPDDEWLLVMDYSQIEYRVIAGYCKCQHLLNLYAQRRDMHKATAAFCFQVPYESVTKALRREGKTINFALSFGMGVNHFYRELGGRYTMEETAQIHSRYFQMLPEVVAAQNDVRKKTDITHSVDTIFGRHQHIPEYDIPSREARSKAQRAGFARIIQGSAADILKISSIKVSQMIEKKYPGMVKYFLSIHDSMIFRGKKSVDVHQFIEDVKAVAEMEIPGYPKFEMAAEIGQNWGNMTEVEDDRPTVSQYYRIKVELPVTITSIKLQSLKQILTNVEAPQQGNWVVVEVNGQALQFPNTLATYEDIQVWAADIPGVAITKEPLDESISQVDDKAAVS